MVLITNLVSNFYTAVKKQRVLVLASIDLDSACATKILQVLFKTDNVEYTLVPVESKDQMRLAYEDYRHSVKSVVLVGCGGALPVLDFMDAEEDAVFYIIDSQRPLDLDNVYNQDQVNVLVFEKENLEDLPTYDQIYASDIEDSDEEDADHQGSAEDGALLSRKRGRRGTESEYERRKQKRMWEMKRNAILERYKESSYHGAAASLIMYDLAKKLARETSDLLWWSMIAVTERYIHCRGGGQDYEVFTQFLEAERARLDHEEEASVRSVNSLKIVQEEELRLLLYRHWSLYDSLCHSPHTSSRFKLWTVLGRKKLHELLADMGLPLVQCKEKFSVMSLKFREGIIDQLQESARKFGVSNLTYTSFTATFGYRHKVSAADMVYSCCALMEKPSLTPTEGFMEILDSLPRTCFKKICAGLELAIHQQLAISSQARSFIDTKQIVSTGPFIFAQLEEGMPDGKVFEHPTGLRQLARHIMETWIAVVKKPKAQTVPYVVSAPLSRRPGYCLVVGIAPYNHDHNKCVLARRFDMAAERMEANAEFNYFDGTVMEIKKSDVNRFLDVLTSLMAV